MPEQEYNPDIVTLCDEDGKEFQFEVLDAIESDDGRYLALLPKHENPEDFVEDSGELVVLKEIQEDEEFYYEEIEDDDEYESIAEAFIDRLSEMFEIEED